MKRRTFASLIFAAASLPFTYTVDAQVIITPGGGQVVAPAISTDQSVAQAAIVSQAPPAGFNAVMASDTLLAQFGYPPRPALASADYQQWLKLVSPTITRMAPMLQQTNISNGPPSGLSNTITGVANSLATTSTNWSGFAQTSAAGTFKHNGDWVFGEWMVPKAQQAFGVCDGTWWYSSQWVGFDGYGSSDVLQAGTEADAYCSGGVTTTFYSAWYEWYPFNEVRISLPVSGGDLMGGEVWYTTTAPYGHAYLVDYTNQHSISINFNPPAGTVYQGNSVEWVVERPGVNGSLANLTNYVADAWNYAYGYGGGAYYYANAATAGATNYSISMTCPPWKPSTSCTTKTTLSSGYAYGPYTLWFYNSGPSF
ncbi:MAG TPA: G1 family glutamic endopeptidase [Bryobacteraceae bacterium]|jgi:hypothetical protein